MGSLFWGEGGGGEEEFSEEGAKTLLTHFNWLSPLDDDELIDGYIWPTENIRILAKALLLLQSEAT